AADLAVSRVIRPVDVVDQRIIGRARRVGPAEAVLLGPVLASLVVDVDDAPLDLLKRPASPDFTDHRDAAGDVDHLRNPSADLLHSAPPIAADAMGRTFHPSHLLNRRIRTKAVGGHELTASIHATVVRSGTAAAVDRAVVAGTQQYRNGRGVC